MADEKLTSSLTESLLLLNGIVIFNPISNELSTNEDSVKLAYSESKMLSLLIASGNDIVSRENMITFSWGSRVVTDASLAKSISNLRKALRSLGVNGECIITVPRVGYRSTLSAQMISNPASPVDLESIYSFEQEIDEPCNHNHLSPANDVNDVNDVNSNKKLHPDVSPETFKGIHFFKANLHVIGYLASIAIISMSIHNFFWRLDRDANKNYIASGYSEINSTINGKSYRIIKEDNKALSEDIKSIISLSPTNSIIFIQDRDDIYNICFFTNKVPSSFTFKKINIDKAKCQIRQFLSKEGAICEL